MNVECNLAMVSIERDIAPVEFQDDRIDRLKCTFPLRTSFAPWALSAFRAVWANRPFTGQRQE